MSAIFGVVRTDGAPVSEREIGRMANMLAHRGPDGRHIAVHDGVGMGHCLMRVTQEDWYEAQPIRDGGVTLVADVRLDNREALASELGIDAAVLGDMPDSAVLLAAYRHWGEGCVDHLLGDFTFAIWDGAVRRLMVARDHMGQRGLFYHHGDGFFAFASEAKALWAVEGVPRRLSEDAIGYRLLFPVDLPPGATLYDAITNLPGGATLQLNAEGVLSTHRYWQPRAAPEHLGRDEAYYIDAFRKTLTEAVACRLRRLTRPPALLFSGGFDSGGIAALAGPIMVAQGRRIVAVCSALDEGERRAVRDARASAEAFRQYPFIDLHYYVRRDENVFSDLETSFAATDDSVGTSYVRRGLYRLAAESGARLVLDGMGGDYTLNVRAGAMLGRMLIRGRIVDFLREFGARRRATGRSVWRIWREDVAPALIPLRLSAVIQSFSRKGRPLWRMRPVNEDFARSMFARGAVDPLRLRTARSVHDRWHGRWVNLLNKAAMMMPVQPTLAAAEGLEFSRPYHDRRVVELGLAIPETLQFRGGLERHLVRRALADILPQRLLASGPGNDAEDPDMFRQARDCAPQALAAARQMDNEGRLSRYIDFDHLESMIASPDESVPADHRRLQVATRVIALARFIAWFDKENR
jgi:asparagine synthase (glutamine-hydrolysing)